MARPEVYDRFDIPEGYMVAVRFREPGDPPLGRAHLYEYSGDAFPLPPMCQNAPEWDTEELAVHIVWKKGVCATCLKRARAKLPPIAT